MPGTDQPSVSFGVTAAQALADGKLDGFWANGMGTEVAVQRGIGTVVVDVRRGDGPPEARHYTFPSLVTTDEIIAKNPEMVEAVMRALVKTQAALREDPNRATRSGQRCVSPDGGWPDRRAHPAGCPLL